MPRVALLLASAACMLAVACSHEAASGAHASSSPIETTPARAEVDEKVATPTPATDASCMNVDPESAAPTTHLTLEGRLFVDTAFEHPSRGKTRPYILRLDEPRCAIGIDEARITEIHLASVEGVNLKELVGKHVRVSGDPFAAHTAWHARPVVLMTTKASAG